jgi:hypothetical protein
MIVFGVEGAATLKECVDAYAEHWKLGPGKLGRVYDPDLDALAAAIVSGRAIGVSARKDGKIVAGMLWWIVRDMDEKAVITGLMTTIGRMDPGVNLAEFIQYGIRAVKARGATRIVLQINEAIPSLMDAARACGANPADRMMVVS